MGKVNLIVRFYPTHEILVHENLMHSAHEKYVSQ